jgi:hypothetical protein
VPRRPSLAEIGRPRSLQSSLATGQRFPAVGFFLHRITQVSLCRRCSRAMPQQPGSQTCSAELDQIEQEMLEERCEVRLLTPVVLNTNFMSDLRRYVSGEDFRKREEFESPLDFILQQAGRSVDYRFDALENLRQVLEGNIPWPYREVAAALFYSSAPAAFRVARGKPAELDKFLPRAEEQFQSWVMSPVLWDTLLRRDVVYCILLRTFIECWKGSTLEDGRFVEAIFDDDFEFQQTLNDLLPRSTRERIVEQLHRNMSSGVSRHALSPAISHLEK